MVSYAQHKTYLCRAVRVTLQDIEENVGRRTFMTTFQTPIIVGIFQDEVKAKNAVDTLRDAGFRYDQVGVAIQSSQNATPNLQSDLENLGVPQEQASYYDDEYKAGHIVVSVRPDGRDSEAKTILDQNGAYDFQQAQQEHNDNPNEQA